MKKVTKIFSLLLVVVLLASVLTGCTVFGKNTAKYRAQTLITVGDEEIKLSKILDFYISNYYNYYSYLSGGYMTVEQLFEVTMDGLYANYSKLDKYKKDPASKIYTEAQNSYVGKIANIQYLNQVEANFTVSYIMYTNFTNFDTLVDGYVAAEIAELATLDAEDKSRDWLKYDELNGATSYAEYLYQQAISSEDIEKYLSDYYGIDYKNDSMTFDYADQYVYKTQAAAQKRIDNINERLKKFIDDGDDEVEAGFVYPTITFEQLKEWQQKAITKYEKSIKRSYGLELSAHVSEQIADSVVSVIAEKYNRDVNLLVESNENFESNILARFNNLSLAQIEDYSHKPDAYTSFVEALSDTSYIYNIPEIYKDKYVYVKNLLIPFDAHQTALLTNKGNIVGTDSDIYKEYRLKLAAEIAARDFNVKDEEASDAYIESFFEVKNDKIVIKNGSVLANYFGSGVSNGNLIGTEQDFIDLMLRFNTDVGQHATVYDYVVRIGDVPDSYTAQWVPEFVDAANEAYNNGNLGYSICVSTYGVHIVLYTGKVTAWTNFDKTKMYDSSSQEYSFLKSYYNAVLSIYTTPAAEELEDEYKYGGKIKIVGEFDKFLKEYGFTYDFEEATTKK